MASSPFLDPGAHVCGVLFGIVGDTALGGHKDTGQLRAQLFLGIIDIPETEGFSECRPVQTRLVSAEMSNFVQNRAVEASVVSAK